MSTATTTTTNQDLTVSVPLPAHCASLEDVRSRILRSARLSYRQPLWEFVSEISGSSFTLFAEWDSFEYLTLPFQVSVSYTPADGMLHYSLLTDGPSEFSQFFTESFVPRVHPAPI